MVSFSGPESDEALPDVELTYIPEGLEKTVDEITPSGRIIVYESQADNFVGFTLQYDYMDEESGLFTDYKSDSFSQMEVKINGNYGELYLSKTGEDPDGLIWFDIENNIYFIMTFALSVTDVLHIAEGTNLCKQ